MASTGEKEILTRWPVVDGDTFRTDRTHTTKMFLVPEKKSLISRRHKIGL